MLLECGNNTNVEENAYQGKTRVKNQTEASLFVPRGSSVSTKPLNCATARKFITDLCQHTEITHVDHSFNPTVDVCVEKTNTHFLFGGH